MKTANWVNINGNIVSPEKATISVFNRSFLYGESVYEVFLGINGKILFMKEHFDRLKLSSQRLGFHWPWESSFLENEVHALAQKESLPRSYIRIILYRNDTEVSLATNSTSNLQYCIFIREQPPYPDDFYNKGVSVAFSSIVRNSKKSTDPEIKSGNYLNNIMALNSVSSSVNEAIMVNAKGEITEGTTSNIWFIKNNKAITPALDTGILKGITRQKVYDICHHIKTPIEEVSLSPEDAFLMDECFLTSTTREILPVVKINDKIIGNGLPGPITKKIMEEYKQLVLKSL